VVVATLNYFLTRNKTSAETEKLRLESEKLRRELTISTEGIASITHELSGVAASASYQLSGVSERVIYETKNRDIGHDFNGVEGTTYKRVDGKDVPASPKGLGSLNFENGILNVRRTNTEGRYEIWLHTYMYGDTEKQVIPQDDLIAGQRRLRISCDVKVVGGEHTLKFVFVGKRTGGWLARKESRISDEQWTPLTNYFLVSPKEDCQLRIQDQDVSHAPSSMQIRNLTLAEKIS
jgi:hypothetical protein